jgi:GT2 family glycosyltransferase
MNPASVVIAIPVKNAEAQLGACLNSLGTQTRKFDRLVLLLNNCTDASLDVCNRFAAQLPGVEIFEKTLIGNLASVDEARRLALHYAAAPGADSIILTTDADAVLERSWIEKNMREIENGAQVVCGVTKTDPLNAGNLQDGLHLDHMRERVLLDILDEIAHLVDPDPNDPWPRHQQQSGASIAITRDVFYLASGMPHEATVEDQALVERLRLVDARIRHAPDIVVNLSGKPACGMATADTAKRRIRQQDALADETLEPATDALRRVTARARLREVRQGRESEASLAQDLLIDLAEMQRILAAPFHGQAWAAVQAASPVLRYRRRVAFAGLDRETRIALELRDRLRIENQAVEGMQHAGRPDA